MSHVVLPAQFKLFIFDLDGTLHVDGQPIAGASELLATLRRQQYLIRFMTNTTSQSQQQLLQQLHQAGIAAAADEILSAPEASRRYLREQQQMLQRAIKIWPVVNEQIRGDYAEFIFEQQQPDFVVIGDIAEQWSYALLNQIFSALNQGAKLIALHKNRFWQTQSGLKVDIGLFIAGLEYVSKQNALIIGKPAVTFFQQVLASAQCDAHQAVLIGDDIDSDVGGAQRAGIFAILVQTGKYRSSYQQQSKIRPDLMLESVAHLRNYLLDLDGDT
jgi:HAD superfamily hydrolase (TIGR01458 family)